MGIESVGSKPIQQGEAGLLTQEQIDELNAAQSAPEAVKTPETVHETPKAEEAVDTSLADLASESAPVAPLSPERHAEVMEQIGQEETRLESNLKAQKDTIAAADERFAALEHTPENKSKKLLRDAKIAEVYEKTKSRIATFSQLGFVGTSGVLLLGEVIHGQNVASYKPMFEDPSSWVTKLQWLNQIGTKVMESGWKLGIAVAAAASIAQTVNWLRRRSQDKAKYAAV